MSFFESRVLNNWRFLRALVLVFCSGLFATGCGGGGGGGRGTEPAFDPEGDTPGNAVVVVPDGGSFAGAIDFGGDDDWFTFRAGQGITYTLQIVGFPPDPSLLPELDLTDRFGTTLAAQIVSFNGVDQIANTTGTDGGEPYDIDPAPQTPIAEIVFLGDSRIIWAAPTTNDFFIKIEHIDELVGTGHYVLNLSSSQRGLTNTGRVQSAEQFIEIRDDDDECFILEDFVAGFIGGLSWDFSLGGVGLVFSRDTDSVFFKDCDGVFDDDPQTKAFHLHWGIPDIRNPLNSAQNFQPCPPDDPHCFMLDLGDDPSVRVELPDEVIRTMAGFDWYFDAHFTDDFDTWPFPVAVSMPWGDLYSLFESEMPMSESSVSRDGSLSEAQRSHIPDFTLFYDSSLKALQIARRTYNSPFLGGLFAADAESFAGDILTVYAPGLGGLAPEVIVAPSVIPNPKDPPDFLDLTSGAVEPGFRNVIRQLSDAEAEDLRDAYYETGIYFEVTDAISGQPISRADVRPLTPGVRSLEIQDVPFPEIFIPTRSSGEPLRKGTINFASDYTGGGQITVISNGQVLGVLNDFLEEGQTPECGETHTGQSLAAEYWPNSYPYKAVAEDGTEWQGHFEILGGACETLVLSVE